MTTEILDQTENLRVRLVYDMNAQNPRDEFDHVANVVTLPNARHTDVDKEGGPLAYGWRYLLDRYYLTEAAETFERWARIFHGAVTMYDSSHDGAACVWYLTGEVIEREGIADPMACLKAERDEYRAWAEGDVWGYVIERRVTWTLMDADDEMHTWEHEESCFGFYGLEYAEESASEAFKAVKMGEGK